MIAQLAPVYGALWQLGVLRKWASCDLLHVMLHGTGLKLIQRARSDGAKVIVEPVNQHPEKVNQLLGEEADRFGLRPIQSFRRIQQLQIEEAKSGPPVTAHTPDSAWMSRSYARLWDIGPPGP